MAIKFEKIRVGMMLYDRHSERCGRTKIQVERKLMVHSIDPETRSAEVACLSVNPGLIYRLREEYLTRLSVKSKQELAASRNRVKK